MEKKSLIARMKELFSKVKNSNEIGGAQIDEHINAVRIIDAKLERFMDYRYGEYRLRQDYDTSCPYVLPKGMSLKQACYIISYLYNKITDDNRREYRKKSASQETAEMLDKLKGWGFVKMKGYDNSLTHAVCMDKDPQAPAQRTPSIDKIDGVADLFRLEYGAQEFARTDFKNRYFEWYSKNANEYGANKIFMANRDDQINMR